MKFLRFFTLLLVATFMGGNLYAQKDLNKLMLERGEYYFSLNVQQLSEVQSINSLCSVDQIDGNNVICYANQKQFDNLLKYGYQPTLLPPPSMQNEVKMWDSRSTYEWDSYLTYEQYEAMMQQFTADHPGKCTYMELGTLNSGRKIMLCRLNNGETTGKPKVLMTSTMHGDEVTGMIMQLRLIDYLLTSNDDEAQFLMDNLDIFISPDTNPDGTYHGGNNNVSGATRYNANYVDLNRHFPDFDDGPHPDGASHYENEAIWMMDLAEEYHFTLGANYHGGAEVMNYPWDTYQPHCADDDWWQFVCHEYADLTHEVNPNYMNGFDDGITNGYAWYTITGSRQDYMNYYQECREVTIECSNDKTPSASQLPNFWNYNKEAMLTFMHEALYGIQGVVTDSLTGEPLEGAVVTIEGHDHHGSAVSTHEAGYYHRPIKGGTYTVTYTANGYYPKTYTLTIADHETLIKDVQLRAGEGLIPNFEATSTNIALNGKASFIDKTWGAKLVSWEWQFEGATPSTSTEQNPSGITYNEVGTFNVSLTVTNADGQTETITKSNYITVSESYLMHNGTITTCGALFFDSGGADNNYGDSENYTMTIMPQTPNAKIEANFVSFSTESGYDHLYVYDGSSTNATLIGKYSGSYGPGLVTATNAEGTLTFRFESDYSQNLSGWIAEINCVFAEPLTLTVIAEPEVINEGESSLLKASAEGGSGEYTYSWEPEESLNDPFIAEPIATPEKPTTYRVTVSDGYSTVEGEIFIDIRDLGINENTLQNVSVYPNPAKDNFTIACENDVNYTLYNSLGQEIISGEILNGKAEINAQNLQKGVYFLRLSNETASSVQKIVVE